MTPVRLEPAALRSRVKQIQTAPIGAVCSGSTLFALILNSSVMLGNNLQQTTSADDIFRCFCFLGALTLKALITTAADDKFCDIFPNL